ncbi:Patched-related protein 9 [Diplonema papillatum]|nr:Patched-related protein 9 [Diplonema papillatum]
MAKTAVPVESEMHNMPVNSLPAPEKGSSVSSSDRGVQKPPAENFLERLSGKVHTGLEKAFYTVGHVVVERPVITIVCAILFVIVMAQGIWFYDEELSADENFTPQDSLAVEQKHWVRSVYGDPDRQAKVFFLSDDMLSKESITAMFDYKEYIETNLTAQYKDQIFGYETVCGRYSDADPCKDAVSILSAWNNNRTRFQEDPDILATINDAANWRRIVPSGPALPFYLSGVRSTTVNGAPYIESATAAQLSYLFRFDKEAVSGEGDKDPETDEFELSLADWTYAVRAQYAARYGVNVHSLTQAEKDRAAGDAIGGDVSSLVAGYALMIAYAAFVLSRGRLRSSHAFLGLASVICVGCSTFAAYGFMWYVGVKFNNVVQVLVLVLLGVGVDDTFVIMDCWEEQFMVVDLKERMKKALSRAGPAIIVTSLTDLTAFLAGSSTSFPALRDFCYYAATGIAFDFVFQVTMFVAIAYLDTVREAKSKSDCFCCVTVKDTTGCFVDGFPCLSPKSAERGLLKQMVGVRLPRLTVGTTVGKVVVLALASLVLGIAIWGCTEVRMNFDQEWFVPSDADVREAFDVRDEYFEGRNVPFEVYYASFDFSTEAGQSAIRQGLEIVNANEYVVDGSGSAFLDPFILHLQSTVPNATDPSNGQTVPTTFQGADGKDYVTPAIFIDQLRRFASVSLGPRSGWPFIDDLRWTEDNSTLFTARVSFLLTEGPPSDGEVAVKAVDSIREACERVLVPAEAMRVFPWAPAFVFWESFDRIIPEVIQNVAIAGSCVLVLVTILVANIFMGLIVLATIGLVDVSLIGFMPWIGVELNSVSVICIVLAIGLSVDYSVHIAHAYLLANADSDTIASAGDKRAAYALLKMGPAVFNGGFSTLLAVLPLFFADSYVFTVFFRMFFLIIVLGQFFGVIVMPVILSFLGPPPYPSAPNLADKPWLNPLDPAFDDSHPGNTPDIPPDAQETA